MYRPCLSDFNLDDVYASQKLFTDFGIGVLHGVGVFHGVGVGVGGLHGWINNRVPNAWQEII